MNFDRVMSDALLSDRHEFVSIFMDNGLHLNEYLSVRHLVELYKKSMGDEFSTMASIHVEITKKLSVS